MRMTVPQNMRTLKSMGQHQRLIRKNLSRQAFGNYNASIQRNHTRTQFNHEFEVVGGNDLSMGQLPE